jgi:hypothetical protein
MEGNGNQSLGPSYGNYYVEEATYLDIDDDLNLDAASEAQAYESDAEWSWDRTYSIASSITPTTGLIDLYTDGGVSNHVNFPIARTMAAEKPSLSLEVRPMQAANTPQPATRRLGCKAITTDT